MLTPADVVKEIRADTECGGHELSGAKIAEYVAGTMRLRKLWTEHPDQNPPTWLSVYAIDEERDLDAAVVALGFAMVEIEKLRTQNEELDAQLTRAHQLLERSP